MLGVPSLAVAWSRAAATVFMQSGKCLCREGDRNERRKGNPGTRPGSWIVENQNLLITGES